MQFPYALTESPSDSRTDALAFSVDDFCRVLGIGRTKTYQLIKLGQLRTVKIGKRTLISREAAIECLKLFENSGNGGAK